MVFGAGAASELEIKFQSVDMRSMHDGNDGHVTRPRDSTVWLAVITDAPKLIRFLTENLAVDNRPI